MEQRRRTNQAAEMWSTPAEDQFLVDPDCSPTKVCKNMVGVSFEGLAEPGTDPMDAWREQLTRDGKLASSSLRDLVLGESES